MTSWEFLCFTKTNYPQSDDLSVAKLRSVVMQSIKTPTTVYRPHNRALFLAVLYTIIFIFWGLFSVISSLINPDHSIARPILAATLFGAFWGTWTILGIYSIFESQRKKIICDNDTIIIHSLLSSKRVPLETIHSVQLDGFHKFGRISIDCDLGVIKLLLRDYAPEDRRCIAQFLIQQLPLAMQNEVNEILQPANTIASPLTWQLYTRLGLLLCLCTVPSFYFWIITDQHYLLASICFLLIGASVCFILAFSKRSKSLLINKKKTLGNN